MTQIGFGVEVGAREELGILDTEQLQVVVIWI